jgi:hypothetical protein
VALGVASLRDLLGEADVGSRAHLGLDRADGDAAEPNERRELLLRLGRIEAGQVNDLALLADRDLERLARRAAERREPRRRSASCSPRAAVEAGRARLAAAPRAGLRAAS